MKSELVKATHLERKAVVYVRQSSPSQMVSHQESLRLQYALRQRARELGWHEADIDIIDTDLGFSAASATHRDGFKDLVARVGLSEVGMILSIDATRLARNCSDWYPLLDICRLRGCLIADRDGVYDPASPNGRLLLGLKGTISELELHTIRSRLTAGLLAKAERGELALTLPVGLSRDPSGVVVKDPNIEVQERLDLLFESFLRLRAAAKVMRMLNSRGLDLPRRDRHGDLRWTHATASAVTAILKNPAYAGAFVFGRSKTGERRTPAGHSVKKPRPMEEWRIVVKDRYPAYIDWPTYQKIRAILTDNRAEYMRIKSRGVPRDGVLLLHGIAYCGRCGHKMFVRYKGGGRYVCNHLRTQTGAPTCQEVRARSVDTAVAAAFLIALAPAELDALSRARRTQQLSDKATRGAIERQLERKRYLASLAERQFQRVDPDNRLVAGELERRWEAALVELKHAEEEAARERPAAPITNLTLGKALTEKVVSLHGQLPEIWADTGTTDANRKALLRYLVDKVVLDRTEPGTAHVRIVWRGGATSEMAIAVPVATIASLARGEEMRLRILEMARAQIPDDEIADTLTREGYRSPTCPDRVLSITVSCIRRRAGIRVTTPRSRWRHGEGKLKVGEMAATMGIPEKWLRVQIRQRRILLDEPGTGAFLFDDTPATREAVAKLRNHHVDRIDLRSN